MRLLMLLGSLGHVFYVQTECAQLSEGSAFELEQWVWAHDRLSKQFGTLFRAKAESRMQALSVSAQQSHSPEQRYCTLCASRAWQRRIRAIVAPSACSSKEAYAWLTLQMHVLG